MFKRLANAARKIFSPVSYTYYAVKRKLKELLNPGEPCPIQDVLAREKKQIDESRKRRGAYVDTAKAEVDKIREEFKQLLPEDRTRLRRPKEQIDESRKRRGANVDTAKAEVDKIREEFQQPLSEDGTRRREVNNDLVGLCFSGGGIRSATFNLGVVTGLAKKRFLTQIDYLSTVSGGGYIGSWLTAWIKREGCVNPQVGQGEGCSNVQESLRGTKVNKTPPGPKVNDGKPQAPAAPDTQNEYDRYLEPDPVRFLRKYSNYLAPRTGLVSTDLWALLAVYFRNVLLNLALLVSAGALVLSLPLLSIYYGVPLAEGKLNETIWLWLIRGLLLMEMAAIAYSFATFRRDDDSKWGVARSLIKRAGIYVILPLLLASVFMYAATLGGRKLNETVLVWSIRGLLVMAMAAIAYSFASFSRDVASKWLVARSLIKRPGIYVILPLLLASVFMTYVLARSSQTGWLAWVKEGAIWYTISWVVGSAVSNVREAGGQKTWQAKLKALFTGGGGPDAVERNPVKVIVVALMAPLFSGALGGSLLYLAQLSLHDDLGALVILYSHIAARTVIGPPLLLVIAILVSILHVGLMGSSFPDAKREWLARLCAMLALTAAGWFVFTGLALYGAVAFKFLFTSTWAKTTWGHIVQAMVASGWVGTTLAGVIGANRANGKPQSTGAPTGILLKLAPPVFILGLFLLLSAGLDASLVRIADAKKEMQAQKASATNTGAAGPLSQGQTQATGPLSQGQPASPGATPTPTPAALSERAASSQKKARAPAAASKKRSPSTPQKTTQPAVTTEVTPAQPPAPPSHAAAGSADQYRDLAQISREHWDTAAGKYLDWKSNAILYLFLALAAVVVVLSWRLDVNEFSIHLLYRNRLTRCYLGASRAKRHFQPFTGFDVDDDLPLASLATDYDPPAGNSKPDLANRYSGPYPLVCTALNLVAGENLAWQTRKARSFIYSPLFCGYDFFIDPSEKLPRKLKRDAYRDTSTFSGTEGPYVGTAMAISGAAATPNMGYHSSPALTFLMGVFNVRLGWWAGNPRHKSGWRLPGPAFALYLGLELFGRTNDEKKFVYLSDGGHFENLGLYELVRRKCRYIIVSDASCDPGASFADLGNAIDKCRCDLGANILIDLSELRPEAGARMSKAHYAFGTIIYSDGTYGSLLYLKSSLTKDDRQDIQAFAAEAKAFPHDTTANQFFNETRFEAYRALGEDVFTSVVSYVEHDKVTAQAAPKTLAGFFAALEELHYRTPARKGSFGVEEVEFAKMKFTFEAQ